MALPLRLPEAVWRRTSFVTALGAAALGALVVGAAAPAFGVWLVVVPVLAGVAWWLVQRPVTAVLAVLAVNVLFENDDQGFLPQTERWYRTLPMVRLTPTDLVLALAIVAVALDLLARRERVRLPGPFTAPLLLLSVATAWGAVTGHFGGGDSVATLNSIRVLAYLIVVPFVVVQVIDDARRVRRAIEILAAAAILKGAVGLVGLALGRGRHVGSHLLTYYAPTANFLMMLFLLVVLGALITRVHLTRRIWAVSLIPLLALALSYRRSFWIAFVVGAVLVAVGGTRAQGRVAVLAIVAVIGVALWATISAGGSTTGQSSNPVLERVQTLRPQKIEQKADDRYRLDEQKNILDEIRRSPIVGIGLGVPWTARHPLSEEHPGGHLYSHTTILWYWLWLGLLGLVAYVLLAMTAVSASYRIWRTHPDRIVATAGLAVAAAFVGLVIAELTGAFTGVEPRITIVVGAIYGWIATALATADETTPQPLTMDARARP